MSSKRFYLGFGPGGVFRRALLRVHKDERGTAAITFLLVLPIFLTILSIIVQMALIANAKIMITEAAMAAARSAMTSLPEQTPENVKKAACFMLAPLSPKGATPTAESEAIANALDTLNVAPMDSFSQRYAYAQAATEVIFPNDNFKTKHGTDIEVTVRYRFLLTVPMAMSLLSGQEDAVGGVVGRFYTIEAKVKIQTSHGRAANSDDNGWPSGALSP